MSTYVSLFSLAILIIFVGGTKAKTFEEITTKIAGLVLLIIPTAVLLAYATGVQP
ncbi:hypothetical protein [Bacillus pumilus]|uniref:hypothetical protein n=1 Tax=Bacillus pumilus TaxID=1408 RepID=UPI0015D541AA|nr:hypothetical protein [Bacillus pumilus]QLI77126.1 hypothetical protein HZ310_04585 [Bacillus pumilus]